MFGESKKYLRSSSRAPAGAPRAGREDGPAGRLQSCVHVRVGARRWWAGAHAESVRAWVHVRARIVSAPNSPHLAFRSEHVCDSWGLECLAPVKNAGGGVQPPLAGKR